MRSKKHLTILGVVLARGGSKGIPRKNLVKLMGKPLIQYTFEAALASRELERVILSTDDDEIAALGLQSGIEVPFRRPKSLSGDRVSSWAVIRHAVLWLRNHGGYSPDAVMTLQPTSPFRQARHIDEAADIFRRRKVDSLIGVGESRPHPYNMVLFSGTRMQFLVPKADRVMLRQQYPDAFYINGAIYITRTPVLFGSYRYGRSVCGYTMDPVSSFEIDEPIDLQMAEALFRLVRN